MFMALSAWWFWGLPPAAAQSPARGGTEPSGTEWTSKSIQDTVFSGTSLKPLRHRMAGLAGQLRREPGAAAAREEAIRLLLHVPSLPLPEIEIPAADLASFNKDGSRILTISSRENGARLWDAATGGAIGGLMEGAGAFTPDGRQIIDPSGTSPACWNAANGTRMEDQPPVPPGKIDAPPGELALAVPAVEVSACSSDGRQLTVSDGKVQIFDSATGSPLTPEDQLMGFTLYGSGRLRLHGATGDSDWTLKGDIPKADESTVPVLIPLGSVTTDTSPDRRRTLLAGGGPVIRILHYPRSPGIRCDSPVKSARFSPDGSRILAVCEDGIAVYSAIQNAAVDQSLRTGVESWAPAASPDHSRILTATGSQAQLWSGDGAEKIGRPAPLVARIGFEAVFSPDSSRLLIHSSLNTSLLMDTATGAEFETLVRHDSEITSASFSPDNKLFLTCSRDGSIQIRAAGQGELWCVFGGKTVFPHGARFSPDSSRVMIFPSPGYFQIWNVADGQPAGRPIPFADHGAAAGDKGGRPDYSPDGKWILTVEGQFAVIRHGATGEPDGLPVPLPAESAGLGISQDSRFLIMETRGPGFTTGVQQQLDLETRQWISHGAPPPGTSPMPREKAFYSDDNSPRLRVATAGLDAADLPGLLEYHAGGTMGPDGSLTDTPAPLRRLWREKFSATADAAKPLGRWLFSSSRNRTLSPLTRTTIPVYIRREIDWAFQPSRYDPYYYWVPTAIHRAYQLDPSHPLIHFALSGLTTKESRREFLRDYGLAHLPEDVEALTAAARFLLHLDDAPRSLAAVTRAAALAPGSGEVRRLQLKVLQKLKRWPEGLTVATALLDGPESTPEDFEAAADFVVAAGPNVAGKWLASMIRKFPNHHTLRTAEGLLNLKKKDYTAAARVFNASKAMAGTDVRMDEKWLAGMAAALWLKGDRREAVRTYAELAADNPLAASRLRLEWKAFPAVEAALRAVDAAWADHPGQTISFLRFGRDGGAMSRQGREWTLSVPDKVPEVLRMEGPIILPNAHGRMLRSLKADGGIYCIPNPDDVRAMAWEWKEGFGWLPWYSITVLATGDFPPP